MKLNAKYHPYSLFISSFRLQSLLPKIHSPLPLPLTKCPSLIIDLPFWPHKIVAVALSDQRLRVFSKFSNDRGVVRSLPDLIWTLSKFEQENPDFSIIGKEIEKLFRKNKKPFFLEQKQIMWKMISQFRNNVQRPVEEEDFSLEEDIQQQFNEQVEGSKEIGDDFTIDDVNHKKSYNAKQLQRRRCPILEFTGNQINIIR